MKKPLNFAQTLTKLYRLFAILSVAGVLSASSIVPGATASPAPQKTIDDWTDSFFYHLHPELENRKIRADETEYINEWAAIEEIIRDSLVYERECATLITESKFEWVLSQYDNLGRNGLILSSPVLDKVADAVFYARYPELGDRKIQPGETSLASEWLKIRRSVSRLHPCY